MWHAVDVDGMPRFSQSHTSARARASTLRDGTDHGVTAFLRASVIRGDDQNSTDALSLAKRGATTEVGTSHRPPGLNAVL